jgi:phenylpropionate dioxygenase-like ring-hydroxylating dioxygenase large terminal subunit
VAAPGTGDGVSRSPIPLPAFDTTDVDVRRAETLPPACYTSDEFFEFEKDAIFFREWLCVGRAEQIPSPGDYFTVTLVDEPLVILRDDAGQVAAFSAVCRHRSAIVVDGSGNCGRTLRCPYHWWTYGLDGRLLGATEMHQTEGFRKEDIGLPRLKVELWNGFIFVNFDAGAAPLAPRLRKLEAVLANYHAAELVTTRQFHYEAPWNWKIMLENGTEHYHAVFLHSKYLPREAADAVVPEWEGDEDGSIVSIVPVPVKDLGISPNGVALWPPIPTLTEEERSRFVFACAPPNLNIGLEADLILWFILLPQSAGLTNIEWAYCVPKDVREMPQFEEVLDLVHRGVEAFNHDDFPINAGMQRGLRSRLAARGRYSVEEATASQVARWAIQRYRAEHGREAGRENPTRSSTPGARTG